MFRVVLTGDLVQGFSRDAVLAALARFFDVPARDLIDLFDGTEYLVEQELDTEGAASMQRRLETIGAKVRVEPVTAVEANARRVLHASGGNDPAAAGLMRCPACGHTQLVADRCDECGVVFAEYNRDHTRSSIDAPAAPRPGPAPQRANARHYAQSDWRNDWLEAEDEVPTEEYHLQLFMGPRAVHLTDPCQRMAMGQRTVMRPSWLWPAVFSPFLWAIYRKMWLWGMVLFVLDVFLPVLAVVLGVQERVSDMLVYAGIGLLVVNRLVWPVFLKGLYCRHARSTIAYMHRVSPTFAPDIDIVTAGGTSRTSVFAGLVLAIVVSLLTWNLVDTLHDLVAQQAPIYVPPPEIPLAPTPTVTPAKPTVEPQDKLLANENKWVATRNRLRVLGQRVNAWLVDLGSGVDPATLEIRTIAGSLSLEADATTDGWGRPIRYESDGTGYRLISSGPDGEFSTADDVDYRRTLQR